MNLMPLVSVIIPTYNRANLVLRAIESVLSQTYQNVEVILVDDGSTDNTKTAVEPYKDKISYIAIKNNGQAHARNVGMKASTGKYIAFLDSDDVYLPHKLELQVLFMEKYPEVAMVYSEFSGSFPDGRLDELHLKRYHLAYKKNNLSYGDIFNESGTIKIGALTKPVDYYMGDLFPHLLTGPLVSSNTVLFKREILDKIGLQNESYTLAEDFEFVTRICKYYKVAFLNIPTYVLNYHFGQVSNFCSFERTRRLLDNIHVLEVFLETMTGLAYNDKEFYAQHKESVNRFLSKVYELIGNKRLEYGDRKKARESFAKSNLFIKRQVMFWVYYCYSFFPRPVIQALSAMLNFKMEVKKAAKKLCIPLKQGIIQSDKGDPDKLTAKIIRNIEELGCIKEIWEEKKFSGLLDYGLYVTIVSAAKKVIHPFVILVKKNENAQAVVLGKVEKTGSGNKLISKILGYVSIKTLTIIELGLGGSDSSECSSLIVKTLLECLRRKEIDLVLFRKVRLDSNICREARRAVGLFNRDYFPKKFKHFVLNKKKEFSKLLNKKRRKELKRNWKKLREQYPDNIEIKCFLKKEELAACCKDMERISGKSKHRSFFNSINSIENLECVSAKGSLKVFILYLNNIPVAYYMGFIKDGVFFYISTGYDRDYRELRVGALLMWKTIEHLWADHQIKAIDFGSGDYLYKQNICDLCWEEADFYIFQTSLKGVLINMTELMLRSVHGIRSIFCILIEKVKNHGLSR